MKSVIDRAAFIMGPEIGECEGVLAEYVSAKHGIACSSGTDALLLALMAYNIKPGDEIITPTFTFISTAEVISFLGAKPVFVDSDNVTYNLDPDKIAQAITNKTKGIIAVNIFGQCADFDTINSIAKENNLFVIEDAAQSFGAKYKNKMSCSLGDVGCTSFFPAKPLGCFGDGGMIFTDNGDIAQRIRSLSNHGKGQDKYDNVAVGINGRLDTLQAAIILAKFNHFPDEVIKRNAVADIYTQQLSTKVQTPVVVEHNLSVYAQYSIVCTNRNKIQKSLKEQNLPTAIHYPKPLHLQSAYAFLGYKENSFPIAEELSRHILSLPMHPFLEKNDQQTIIDAVIKAA